MRSYAAFPYRRSSGRPETDTPAPPPGRDPGGRGGGDPGVSRGAGPSCCSGRPRSARSDSPPRGGCRAAWAGVSVDAAFEPARAFAGEPIELRIRIANAKRLPLPIVRVLVRLPDGLAPDAAPGSDRAPGLPPSVVRPRPGRGGAPAPGLRSPSGRVLGRSPRDRALGPVRPGAVVATWRSSRRSW